MDSNELKSPLPLQVTACNWFHEGWLHALLGCKRRDFGEGGALVLNSDCEAYNEGYNMAMETDLVYKVGVVCEALIRGGKIKVSIDFGNRYGRIKT